MPTCSRRYLLQMTGALAAGHTVQALAQTLAPAPAPSRWHAPGTRLYAAIQASSRQPAGVGTYAWSGEAWRCQHFLPASGVGPLLAEQRGEFLFAAHDAGTSGLPAGFVEALRIDPQTGRLSRGQRQSLALASLTPRAMALSPDGRLLAVVAAGGVFSLLPVQPDGSLAEVSAAHKQLALPICAEAEMSLFFGNVAGRATDPAETRASRLTLRTGTQSFEYACRPDGLTFVGTSDATIRQSAMALPPPPYGSRSFVLQTPQEA